ncbi:MAG: UDP-glucose/GDP-mannose dehydrogenase family protein [Synechococcales bacterium]|nr:UDP-glucose/GDP-mannose dehydrogenase family protein [Synechococcales bacterium]
MKISIFGLGYVGVVTAACLARDGHEVIGVDINADKVALVNSGKSPIVEPGLDHLLTDGVNAGRIRATTEADEAVLATEVSLISVGTPATDRGEPELSYVFGVCKEIGAAVYRKPDPHVVVLRSTVPPGTLEQCAQLFRETARVDSVSLAFNPEFLREGSAIGDYDQPPYTIIGTTDPTAEQAVRQMYAAVDAPIIVTPPAVAEMVKYVANTWHATKVSFANEVGRIAKGFGLDGRDVMNLIVQDTKLNISPTYLRPGFAYGGSCLPKDVSALLACARRMDIPVPMLSALPLTNQLQIEVSVQEVMRLGVRRITVLGLAFKPKTDDLRESPAVLLIKRLIGEGCEVKIYDKAVHQAWLVGTNLAYIQRNIPHFEALLVAEPETAIAEAELVIVTHATSEIQQLLRNVPKGTRILDLAGVFTEPVEDIERYGITW